MIHYTPVIRRTARKEHTCELTAQSRRLGKAGVDWRTNPDLYGVPCLKNDDQIRIGEQYVQSEGDDEFHPSRYHVVCWDALS